MRLTLRNLLAYMDDILEPADAQVLAKKIQESEFATGLMHRIRDVTRRLRMAAPKVDGRGMGLDPNTVAEYLDNTLPSERVADFEKICLESDIHLAEVASSHQILALVLGEPADIDPAMRARMYRVGSPPEVEPTMMPSIVTSNVVASATPASEPRTARKKLEVPDYLREHAAPRSGGRLVAAAVILLLVGGGIAASLNLDKLKELLPGQVAENPAAPAAGNPAAAPAPATQQPAPTVADANTQPAAPAMGAAPVTAPPTANPPAVATQPAASTPPAMIPTAMTPAVTPPAGAPTATSTAAPAVASNPPTPPGQLQQPVLTPAMPSDRPAAAPTAASTPAPEPPKPSPTAVATSTPPAAAPAGMAPVARAPAVPAPEGATAAVPPEGMGRLVSEREVLLRLDRPTQSWVRLTTRATVYPGDRLLSLPTYRSSLTLSAGMSVQMLGGTLVDLLPPDSHGVPGVRLFDGRMILMTPGKPGAQVKLWIGSRQGVVTFDDADATLAVQISRDHVEGTNPEKEPALVRVNLLATAGQLRWSDETNLQPLVLTAPARMVMADLSQTPTIETIVAESLPTWIKGDELPQIEQRASTNVQEELEANRPITLGLKELAGDRRAEVASLAIQCLCEIDEFDAFIAALQDPAQRAAWPEEIDAVRAALARSPATAEKVRLAFERHRGTKGDDLYRMLWGYSPDQLQGGAAEELVKNLDHDDLDFRELAIWNLTRIAGAPFFYQPQARAAERQRHIRTWKQKLDSGALFGKPVEKQP